MRLDLTCPHVLIAGVAHATLLTHLIRALGVCPRLFTRVASNLLALFLQNKMVLAFAALIFIKWIVGPVLHLIKLFLLTLRKGPAGWINVAKGKGMLKS